MKLIPAVLRVSCFSLIIGDVLLETIASLASQATQVSMVGDKKIALLFLTIAKEYQEELKRRGNEKASRKVGQIIRDLEATLKNKKDGTFEFIIMPKMTKVGLVLDLKLFLPYGRSFVLSVFPQPSGRS